MASNSPDIETGTEVFGSDGNKIGTVSRIFSAAPPPADTVPMGVVDTPADPHPTDMEPGERSSGQFGAVGGIFRDDDETDGGSGTEIGGGAVGWGSTSESVDLSHSESGTVLTPSETKYIEVHHGGLLGLGGSSLYVPFDAIEVVTTGESITLKYSKDEAASLFAKEPAPLA